MIRTRLQHRRHRRVVFLEREPLIHHALVPLIIALPHVTHVLCLRRQHATRRDRLLHVQIPIKHTVVILDGHLLAQGLMRDGVHDPLVVDAVHLTNKLGVVLSLERRVDEQRVRWLEGELRHLVVRAHKERGVAPRVDRCHPALDRVALPIKVIIVETRTRLEKIFSLLAQALVLNEVHRMLRTAVYGERHGRYLQLPHLDCIEHPQAVLSLGIRFMIRVRLWHPIHWVRHVLDGLCWRILVIEGIRTELCNELRLERLEALRVLRLERGLELFDLFDRHGKEPILSSASTRRVLRRGSLLPRRHVHEGRSPFCTETS